MWPPLLLVALLPAVSPFLLYGCIYSPVELCEGDESCYPDGLFGQCYSPTTGAPEPTKVGQLDDEQLELLTLELTRLAKNDQDWGDSRTQCVLAYYKLSMAYNLQYDPEFCNVRYPTNIWALIQLIDIGLNENAQLEGGDDAVAQYAEPAVETAEVLQVVPLVSNDDDSAEEDISELLQQISEPPPEIEVDDVLPESSVDPLVENYIQDIVARETPDLSQLSDEQLNDLLTRLFLLKKNLDEMAPVAQIVDQDGEAEEAIPLDEAAMADEQSILKKDAEHVGNVQLGLDNTEHKIVKGRNALSRVVGNRVYLKVNKVKDEKQLAPLVEYLENTIALPNNLIFDDFQFDNGQLSMRISRFLGQKPKTSKRIDSVEGVAQAVYKRRKDIARFSGAEVAETGIGSGEDTVPVESTDRDWLFRPVLVICGFTIMALLTVLGAHFYRSRKHYHTSIAQMAEGIEGGKNSHAYQELCRQRVGETSPRSKSSSTSSWCGDETQAPAIDISTGHVVLTFLQEFLSDPSKIEAQWNSLKEYRNHQKHTGMASQFVEKNRECLPFDENLVEVDTWKPEEKAYINASFLYDDDPRQAVYIAAQSPRGEEIAAWWQAVWQHGVCLIVNLSTLDETKAEKSYWPETGSQVHGPFEIHLVSEHIWSDDYLVRSFYLKNLQNGETRTITQFHYLSWKKDSTPPSAKSLLEFRRKVNKSYRGRSSPVLVHSWDGVGRVGVYCTLDLLCARLLRGVRQIDVAASVEHLRDQRDGMVRNGDQFKLIYGCLAQEVSALLKSAAS